MTDNERDQVQEVFGLTGGELADEPWIPNYVTETFGETRGFTFPYWYEGVPEYAESDFSDWSWGGYRTVCRDEMFGPVPETVTDDQGTWSVVSRFGNSGERECPAYGQSTADDAFPVPCPLCDAQEGEEHGYIYLGDGWSEIVYRLTTATFCDRIDCPGAGHVEDGYGGMECLPTTDATDEEGDQS